MMACPVCNSNSTKFSFKAKDHTVSGEFFEVWYCNDCTLMFTANPPKESEIGKYYAAESYISHTDSNEGLINKLYHRVRVITLASKRKLVVKETGKSSGNLLDIGSGTGAFANEMNASGWKITALEPDELARKKSSELHNINALPTSNLFKLEEQFDAITMWHVLEHVYPLHEYIEQIKKLLKPGGKIFIAVPNYQSLDANKYSENWAAWDVPRHLYHFSPQSMRKLLSIHGLNLLKMKPMWFDSFYVSMLSEKYKNGKNNLISAVQNGLVSNMKAMNDNSKCSSVIYVIGA